MLEHGGGVRAASRRFGIPAERWLDLSTGINPHPWPVPPIPPEVWNRLPEPDDGLEAAACAYYGAPALLPLAGSQAAIQGVPRLRPPGRVAVVSPTYAEHGRGWREAGHQVVWPVHVREVESLLLALDVLVVVNPNNPTGRRFRRDEILAWHAVLAERGGWLVVDEAFMDTDPAESVADVTHRPGLLVLRSVGKFFGLAGARCGFLLAEEALLRRAEALLGPWTVPAPTRWVAQRALADAPWIAATRDRLGREGGRLAEILTRAGLSPAGGTGLFQWVRHPAARQVQEALGRQGILVRAFDAPSSLRFGLPGEEAGWVRLEQALAGIAHTHAHSTE